MSVSAGSAEVIRLYCSVTPAPSGLLFRCKDGSLIAAEIVFHQELSALCMINSFAGAL